MAEWLIEEGIGEMRALLIEGDAVRAAKLTYSGELRAGEVLDARLIARSAGSNRGTALTQEGTEVLVDRLPQSASEGAQIKLVITRASAPERERTKRAQARPYNQTDKRADTARSESRDIFALGKPVHRFPKGAWEEVWSLACAGACDFTGGHITLSPTPAMTLIDVDGTGHPFELACAAVPAIARAIHYLDLGGSIGIDFPTLETKAERSKLAANLAQELRDFPHECTAVNGFGFVQMVAAKSGPSLLDRLALNRAAASARMLLRQAERIEEAGVLLLTCHPAVKAQLSDALLRQLAQRSARASIAIEIDSKLDITAGFAQAIAS